MRVFDSSSIIYAWDNYPINQFPPLWAWIATRIGEDFLTFSYVSRDEIERNAPDCLEWLLDHDVSWLDVTNEIMQTAVTIKNLLGIVEDDYGGGVGENDLLIIATAKCHRAPLVSNEKRQLTLPTNLKNCQIPAVCSMPGVRVQCIDFLKYIKDSREEFS